MHTIYLTDDHAILREGLKALLHHDQELVVTGESGTGRETIRDVCNGEYDVLVLDIKLPDIDGFEVLLQLKRKKPKLRILILTLRADATLAMRLLKAGATGVAIKEMPPLQIIDAIRRVARDQRFLAQELAARIADRISDAQNPTLHERLTNREYTIFLKLAAGIPIAVIAKELNIAPTTVSTHRTHILEKMELANNADLARYAVSHELLT